MMSKKHIIVILIVILTVSLQALGKRDSKELPLQELSGTVRLVGNDPFLRLVLSDSKGQDYYFAKEDYEKFRFYSQMEIKVSVRLNVEPIHSADGKFITNQYTLIDPLLIE